MLPHLKNKEIHGAIFALQLVLTRALARAGGVSSSKARIRIVFADRADCAAVTSALMQEMLTKPHEVPVCNPPRFQICGVDVALLTEDR